MQIFIFMLEYYFKIGLKLPPNWNDGGKADLPVITGKP